MLMRTDPFRDLDRVTQQVFGTPARPAAMPMDAWREGDEFFVELDLPGIDPESLDLDIERNVVTVRACRPELDQRRSMIAAERTRGVFSRQLFLGREPRHRGDPRRLPRRGAAADHPGRGEGQTPQDRHHPRRNGKKPSTPDRRVGDAFGGGVGDDNNTRNGHPAHGMAPRRAVGGVGSRRAGVVRRDRRHPARGGPRHDPHER